KPYDLPRWALLAICISMFAVITAFAIPYFILARRVDKQLASGTFQHTFSYFSAPETLSSGDPIYAAELAGALKRSGYSVTATGRSITLHATPPVEIQFANGAVSSIVDLNDGRRLTQTELPPQLVTNMSDDGRAKRVVIHFQDIPPILIRAVVSVEDKR